MSDIAVITVEFRNPDDTAGLARSLANLDGSEAIELIVVDNSPGVNGTHRIGELRRQMPYAVRGLTPASNLYYWGGAAFAIDTIRESGAPLPRWMMVCNNDITVPDPQFLTRLRSLDPTLHPIVAPRVTSLVTGKEQNPFFADPPTRMKRARWRLFDAGYPIAKLMLGIHGAFSAMTNAGIPSGQVSGGKTHQRRIYAPHGACVILSSAFFLLGGSLDTGVPMFAEELTIAEEARRLGVPVWYVPALHVHHFEHSTTGSELTRTKYEFQRSAHRHYFSILSRPALQARLDACPGDATSS